MAFPSENKTLTGKDGSDITLANARKATSYTGNSWTFRTSFGPWDIDEDTTFPFLDLSPVISSTFPQNQETKTGVDGEEITIENAKKAVTYTGNSWDFTTIWDISENNGYPILLAIETLSFIKTWTGTEWVPLIIYVYNGTYEEIQAYKWDGENWV
jgi:hypothetical protein